MVQSSTAKPEQAITSNTCQQVWIFVICFTSVTCTYSLSCLPSLILTTLPAVPNGPYPCCFLAAVAKFPQILFATGGFLGLVGF